MQRQEPLGFWPGMTLMGWERVFTRLSRKSCQQRQEPLGFWPGMTLMG